MSKCDYCNTEQKDLILSFDKLNYICKDFKACMERMPKKNYAGQYQNKGVIRDA